MGGAAVFLFPATKPAHCLCPDGTLECAGIAATHFFSITDFVQGCLFDAHFRTDDMTWEVLVSQVFVQKEYKPFFKKSTISTFLVPEWQKQEKKIEWNLLDSHSI